MPENETQDPIGHVSSPQPEFPFSAKSVWLLLALSTIVYLRVLPADFSCLDDGPYVTQNKLVQGGLTWAGIKTAAVTLQHSNWHPLTWLSLMLDYQIWGLNPIGFHLTNILLHAANSILLFEFLRRLRWTMGQALFIAGVFAVHPLHVESVAWVTERKDVLSTLFGFLSMLAYVRWNQTRRVVWYATCLISFAFSLSAKPLFVTLPCLLLLLDAWPLGRWMRSCSNSSVQGRDQSHLRGMIGLFLEKWPLWLMTVGSCLVTYLAQHRGGATRSLGRLLMSERASSIIVSYFVYLQKTFWPTHLAVFYPFHMNRWSTGAVVFAGLTLLAVTVYAISLWRRAPGVLIGWLWFLGTLVPMIGVIQVGGQALADRYMYLPLVGLTISVVSFAELLCTRLPSLRWSFKNAAVASLLAMVCLTFLQTGHWRDDEKLARQCLRSTSRNWVAHFMLGSALRRQERNDEALECFRESLAIVPSYSSARSSLALLLAESGKLDAALVECHTGLELDPQFVPLRVLEAGILVRQEKYEAAIADYEFLETLHVKDLVATRKHATALLRLGRTTQALEKLQRLPKGARDDFGTQLLLVQCLLQLPGHPVKDVTSARDILEGMVSDQVPADVWLSLAEAQYANGELQAASATVQRAIEIATHQRRDDFKGKAQATLERWTR